MPANTVTIEDPAGSVTEYQLFAAEIDYSDSQPDQARIDVFSEESPNPEQEIEVTADTVQVRGPSNRLVFGGIVGDVSADGPVVEIIADGVEAAARLGEPSAPNVVRQNRSDSSLIEDAFERSDFVDAGTLDTIADKIKVSFNHARPSEVVRTIQKQTGAFVRYQPDFTVDYRDPANVNLDRSGSVKLSPSNGNFALQSVRRRGATEGSGIGVTHWRGLGEGRGGNQRRVNLVPEDDPEEYENRITYQNPNWSVGDRERWQIIQDQSVTTELELKEITRRTRQRRTRNTAADALTVTGDIFSPLDLEVNEQVTVDLPENNVNNQVLEITDLSRRITQDEGHILTAELSNRENSNTFPAGEDSEKDRLTATLNQYARTQVNPRTAQQFDFIQRKLAERPGGS
jgi:hypothetical protein